MSTRAQIIIKDAETELWFYRHSDGYPETTGPSLKIFLDWLKKGLIRNNVSQTAGWLVILGAYEYGSIPVSYQIGIPSPEGWKVGAYEPCPPQRFGDIEYLYTVNLETQTIMVMDIATKKERFL